MDTDADVVMEFWSGIDPEVAFGFEMCEGRNRMAPAEITNWPGMYWAVGYFDNFLPSPSTTGSGGCNALNE
jgi:hypothetical protein